MTIRQHRRSLSLLITGLATAGLLVVGFGITPLSGSFLGSMLGISNQDFSLTPSSSYLTIPQGTAGQVSITLTSLNHFSGEVSVTAGITTGSNIPTVTTSQSSVKLESGTTGYFSITVSTTSSSTQGDYTVTVQGRSGGLSHSVTITAQVTNPPPPPTPDFYLSSNSSLTASQGTTVTAPVTVLSVLGYSGKISLTTAAYPSGPNSPQVSLNLTSLNLASAGVNSTTIIVNNYNVTAGYYSIVITGSSGPLTHGFTITLSVTHVTGRENLIAEAAIVNSPTNATLYLRNTGSITTSLVAYYVVDSKGDQYSLSSWNGPIIAPNALGIAKILIGSSCSGCVLSGSAFTFTPGNSYSITVVTSYNNLFSFTITLSSTESLSMDSSSFPSNTNVTLYIRNTGAVSVQLASYYVKDATGDQYALVSFAGPTIAPNAVTAVNVAIGSSCPSCTLSGTAFTFTPGNSYTILFVTARNNQFTFTVIR